MKSIDAQFVDIGVMDRLAAGDSPMHRLDPRAKLLTTILFICTVVSFGKYEISALVPFSLYPLCMIVLGNLPVHHLLRRMILVAPFALFAGLSFVVPYLLLAAFVGPELPSVLGALIGLAITILAARRGFLMPKQTWDFGPTETWNPDWLATSENPGRIGDAEKRRIAPFLAWLPYILVALTLVATRIPAFVTTAATRPTISVVLARPRSSSRWATRST